MMELKYYKVNIGLILEIGYAADRYLINGKNLSRQFNGNFYLLENESEIRQIQYLVNPVNELIGFELRDPSLESAERPLFLSLKDVDQDSHENGEEYWNNYRDIEYLYQHKYMKKEGGYKDLQFKATCLGEVAGDISNPVTSKYEVHNPHVKVPQQINLSDMIHYDTFDKIVTPRFAIHMKPCFIDGPSLYKIVRQHIKTKINGHYAQIDSDYDFCFSVNKIILKKGQYHELHGAYSGLDKRKLNTFQIFNMAPKAYQSYNVLKGIYAENLEELDTKIRTFLDTIIELINEPAVNCDCCDGVGFVAKKFESDNLVESHVK